MTVDIRAFEADFIADLRAKAESAKTWGDSYVRLGIDDFTNILALLDAHKAEIKELTFGVESANEQADFLLADLRKYGHHLEGCAMRYPAIMGVAYQCTCGYEEAQCGYEEAQR